MPNWGFWGNLGLNGCFVFRAMYKPVECHKEASGEKSRAHHIGSLALNIWEIHCYGGAAARRWWTVLDARGIEGHFASSCMIGPTRWKGVGRRNHANMHGQTQSAHEFGLPGA